MRRPVALLCALAALGLVPSSVSATTWHVDPEGLGDFLTIQAAINAAANGDTILLARVTFTGAGNKDIQFLGKAIVVRPEGLESLRQDVIIDCEGTGRGFDFQGGETSDARLEEITIINGNGYPGGGGAIRFVVNSSPTISGCHMEDNYANHGGAILCVQSSPQILDCVIVNNDTAPFGGGGGMTIENTSSPLLSNCWIEGNTGDQTGGVEILECSPTLSYCTIANNIARTTNGGGLGIQHGDPYIEHCTIVGNTGHVERDSVYAGGVFLHEAAPTIECSIIAFSQSGAAIWCFDGGSDPTIIATDIYGNADGDWIGCIEGMDAINSNLWMDPVFCDLVGGDYHLEDCSPLLGWSICEYVGAWPLGCACTGVPEAPAVESKSWSRIKKHYR